jgi:hypothetical protein
MMTDDNQPEPTKEEFATALADFIAEWEDKGLSNEDMIGPLKSELLFMRRNIMPSKFDDKYNVDRGLPPLTEAQLREALQLEDYEPIPRQREDASDI